MRHRNFSTPFTTPGFNQHDSNHLPPEQSYIHMGRSIAPEISPSVSAADHTLRGGVLYESQWISEGRATEYPPSSLSMEAQHLAPSFSVLHYDSYPHSSITGSLSLGPVGNVGHGHVHSSCCNRPPTCDVEGGLLNSTTISGRGSLKRKSPDISRASERGSSSRFYCAGSSSGSSQMLMEKPSVDCHSMPPGSIAVPPYRGSSLSIAGEESVRNVKRRSRLELEPNTGRPHFLSHSSHHYYSTTSPANHSGQTLPASSNADVIGREWNNVPLYAAARPGRNTIPDISGSNHERNQLFAGGSSAATVGCHRDNTFSRHQVSSSQYFQSSNAQIAREGRHSFSRRSVPSYQNGLSYYPVGNEAPSSSSGPYSPPEIFSSRYSRHCYTEGWRNSYRNGRPRFSADRFQFVAGMEDTHDGMGPEAMMIVNHSGFYGGSSNLVDQYRDMRLDIDSMSYEELLALGESIGTVSTGLSEDSMLKCLVEKFHYSSDRSQEELSCAICLEEYKNGEKVGSMGKCGHDYHADCIKKWLLMKNVCPICKTECST